MKRLFNTAALITIIIAAIRWGGRFVVWAAAHNLGAFLWGVFVIGGIFLIPIIDKRDRNLRNGIPKRKRHMFLW